MREKLNDLWLRLKTVFRRRQLDRDLEEEIAFHKAMRAQRYRVAGVENSAAETVARKRFGNATTFMEACRELWTFASIEALWADIRYAARVLRKSPAFTVVAVLSLALGIGANTAILNVVRAVLFEPLPVKEPHRLVVARWYGSTKSGMYQFNSNSDKDPATGRQYNTNFSYPMYRGLRREGAAVADVFAFIAAKDANMSIAGQPVVASVLLASGNFHRGIGVFTTIGRPLNDNDDRIGSPPAAVISHAFWLRVFGGDSAVIGTEIMINGSPFTIVGVTQPGFFGVSNGGFFPATDVTVPLAAQPSIKPLWKPASGSMFDRENYLWLRVMARLNPGVADRGAQAVLDGIYRRSIAASPELSLHNLQSPELGLFPGAGGLDSLRKNMEKPLLILTVVVAIVVLIACVNLANLILARGLAREKEMSVRLALGSGRLRLVRQMLAESLLLSLAGGVLGIVLAAWAGPILVGMLTAGTGPVAVDLSLNWRLLGLGALASLAAGMLFGLFPAIRLAAADLAPALNRVRIGAHAPRLGASRLLMIFQIAFSMLLLVGAAVFLRTLHNLGSVALGFNPQGLILFRVDPTLNGYKGEKILFYYRELLRRVESVPGVTSATVMSEGLITGWVSNGPVSVESGEPKQIYMNSVGPRFAETMGMRILTGRSIGLQDTASSSKVAVINEAAAREFFGNDSPLGRRLRRNELDLQIVGVLKDSKYDSVKKAAVPTMFIPYLQEPRGPGGMYIALRTSVETSDVVQGVRSAAGAVDRNIPIVDLKTQSQQIDETLGQERLFTRLLIFFGLFALLLACIGLHGLTAYAVERRTAEIGIRMAFGALRSHVLWMVLRQVVVLAAAGLAIGIPAAVSATRLVRSLLFGLQPGDPLTLLAAAAIMATVAVLAGYLPARRASRMDPLVALRYE